MKKYWTEGELFRLQTLISDGLNYQEIGKIFGKTPEAIRLAQRRNGITPIQKVHLTGRAIAKIMGIKCSKTPTRWIEKGYLKGSKGIKMGRGRRYVVEWDDLFKFLDNEEYWHLWKPENMPINLNGLALYHVYMTKRKDIKFYTTGELDKMIGKSTAPLIRQGIFKAKKKGYNWIVASTNL